jgi:hypothetical protein
MDDRVGHAREEVVGDGPCARQIDDACDAAHDGLLNVSSALRSR